MLTMFPHCLVPSCDRTKRTYEEHELVAQDADDKVKFPSFFQKQHKTHNVCFFLYIKKRNLGGFLC